jgi:RNA polymerase sigma-70 factor (ECF subfamily)
MGEETSMIQSALDRFNAGDPEALEDLFARAAQRLQRMARRMLHGSFERVAALDQTGDVTQEAALRLLKALRAEMKVRTPAEFFRLSSAMIRRVLIDLARHHYGPEGSAAHRAGAPAAESSGLGAPAPTAGSSNAPDALAAWGEFHERVEQLPEEQRAVFDLLWYQDLSQEEAAHELKVSVPTVKRRWRDAKLELIDVLGDHFPGLD